MPAAIRAPSPSAPVFASAGLVALGLGAAAGVVGGIDVNAVGVGVSVGVSVGVLVGVGVTGAAMVTVVVVVAV